MKKLIIVGVIVFAAIFIVIIKGNIPKETLFQPEANIQQDVLKIMSTNPEFLDGAVILPTQNIEFKFNNLISVSEFKHSFDPELEHEIQVDYDRKNNITTIKIIFTKPLDLGSGYTLFILSNTKSEDNKELGKEYQYHFSTIKYKGV